MSFVLSPAARCVAEGVPVETVDGWRERPGLRFVVAAAIGLLRREASGALRRADVDEALLHGLISVDEARPDRVHFRLRHRGADRPFRDVVALLRAWSMTQVGDAIVAVETDLGSTFDVDIKEAFARVVSIYTIQYSNFMPYAPAVRARFMHDPPATQQSFLRVFVELYEQGTDVTHLPGAAAAVEWLRGRRRHLASHTLVLRDDVETAASGANAEAVEVELRGAVAAFVDAVEAAWRAAVAEFRGRFAERAHGLGKVSDDRLPIELQWLRQCCVDIGSKTPSELAPGLAEMQRALLVPPPLQVLSALSVAAFELASISLPYAPQGVVVEHMPALTDTVRRLQAAASSALESAC